MLEPPHEVESVAPRNESRGVVGLPEEDQHSVSVSQGALVVVTAELGLGSQGQYVGIVRHNAAGAVEISHCSPELVDLNMTISMSSYKNTISFISYYEKDLNIQHYNFSISYQSQD